jgi:adenylate cyclase class 2
MACNIELKAILPDWAAAQQVAERLATQHLGTQRQVDTYFNAAHGRLKLRKIDGRSAQLIWYQRADAAGPKPSNYLIVPVVHSEALHAALAGAWGIDAVVAKSRTVYLYHTVRIHLDRVDGLGDFLEFEAVIGPECDLPRATQLVEQLTQAFHIDPANCLAGSYREMLRAG